MAGARPAALIAILLSGWLAAGTTVRAQEQIPLPKPAPFPKEGTLARPPQAAAPPAAQAPSGITGALDSIGRFLSGKPAQSPGDAESAGAPSGSSGSGAGSGFDAGQRALVNRVNNYLTSIQVLSGNFVQIGPDGRRATGLFFIQKPGKVRFEYDPPATIDVVADGQSVAVRDSRLGSTPDLYPLSQTPLRFLLSDRIDLLRDTNVVGVSADKSFVTIIVEEKQVLVGTSRLMMMFDAKDTKLKQWTVTDPQGFDTTIAVSNLDTSKRPDPDLFKIDMTRYMQ
jgi:outer membrane lipoprotein-sorting protein